MQFLTIKKICQVLARKEKSVSEFVEQSLSRAREIKNLNAFISLREKISGNDEGDSKNNNLLGITFAVKDNFSSSDFDTTCGSKMLEGYQPLYNATIISKLVERGAVLIGKTNMDEFAMGSGSVDSVNGPVKNPWTPGILGDNFSGCDWRIAGGSSGGSAVAVATGACSFAIGSDTGGSVRNPASYCGIIGLKPTYGLVSRHGLIPLVNSMDCPSIFARTVDDAAIVLECLKGRDIMDSTTVDTDWLDLSDTGGKSVENLSVGIPKECHMPGMSRDVVNAWRWAADEFENAGAKVVEVSLPHVRYSIICYHVFCTVEVASNMSRFDGLRYGHRAAISDSSNAMMAVSRKDSLNDTVRSRILAGNYFLLKENRKYVEQAQKVRRLIQQDYRNVFSDTNTSSAHCDILLSPTLISDAPLYPEFIQADNRTRSAEQDVLTQSANLAGVPAVTVPSKLSSNGLPIGLQITGNHFSEAIIIKAAKFLESVANFPSLQNRFNVCRRDSKVKAIAR